MKHSFSVIVTALSMSLFFFSCNSGGDTKTSTTDTTAVKTTAPAPAAALGNVLVIMHKVADYAKWKPAYEADDSARRAHGLTNYFLGRGVDDPNMVYVVLKLSDEAKAKEMTGMPEMKTKMEKAGVTGQPTFDFLKLVMSDTTIQGDTRLRIKQKVIDWDAWKKVFDDHKQARMDAGLLDRAVTQSMDDNHIAVVVLTVTDMAKARAFVASPDLKARMEKGGVEGTPEFFFYNVVQKY